MPSTARSSSRGPGRRRSGTTRERAETSVEGAHRDLWENVGMRILVTGGAGFIGANFVHWTRQHRPEVAITVVDKLTYASDGTSLASVADQITFVEGDIADGALMDSLVGATDLVVHFAAESHNDNS